jgi:hypothetical protein
MSGFSNVSNTTKGFGVTVDGPAINFAHGNPLLSGRIIPFAVGNTGTAIPASALYSRAFVVSPSAANQTYTLAPASQIITEYGGFNITTGTSGLAAGNQIPLTVINQSAFPAYIASSPTGGDGTAVIAYGSGVTGAGGPLSTGTVFGSHATNFYLNITAVNASVSGVTGAYSLYTA